MPTVTPPAGRDEIPTIAPREIAARPASATSLDRIAPGTMLGSRYEVLAILGQGGMGTVYKARDLELDRTVALKVIRPDLASRPEILERFKREILLSSQVTHRNVLRIYDLGEAGDIKFLSMSYVEGSTLSTLLDKEGPLSPERALPLVRQIAEALQAAHEAGVVHRDLKPQNILLDLEGNAYIADFGISRSLESGGTMTETGAIFGTVDYMSPEQARGETVDHRSDIYSLGVILYQIFTGSLPFTASNPLSMMMKRIEHDAPTICHSRPNFPLWLSSIVSRAMQRDPAARYQSVADLIRDLERQRASIAWRRLARRRIVIGAAAAVLLAAVATGAIFLLRSARTVNAAPAVSLLLLPFQNSTGDARYEWVRAGVPELLRSELLQSKGVRLAGEDRVQAVIDALKLPKGDETRPASIQRIASLVGADNAVTGSLLKAGEKFRIEARVTRAGAGQTDPGPPIRLEGTGEESIFTMADELTRRIRSEVGVSRGWGETDRKATDLSTRSVEALRLYSEGLALSRAGNQIEAATRLEGAVEKDAGFAIAYARLAETYDRLGYSDKAAAAAEKAVQGLGNTSAYESARIHAMRARLANDLDGAVKAYQSLCEAAPNSAEAFYDLASAQEQKGDLKGALASFQKVISLDPKHPDAHYALGRVQVKLGDAAEALKEFNTALGIYIETGNEEGRATVLNGLGNAYNILSRYDDALKNFRDSLEIRRRISDRRGEHVALRNIAMVEVFRGHPEEALKAAQEAVAMSKEMGDTAGLADSYLGLGDVYLETGQAKKALESYQESLKIVRESGDESMLARNLSSIGYINTVLGRYVEAFFFLKDALAKKRAIGDKAEIRRALTDIGIVEQFQGRYDEALRYYLEGLSLASEMGDKGAAAILSTNLAEIHEDQGEYAATLDLLMEGEKQARETGDKGQTAFCLARVGRTKHHLGDLAGSQTALKEAIDLARQIDNAPILAETLTYQGDLLLSRGQTGQAAVVLKEAVSAAQKAEDLRLLLMARLSAAKAGRSIRDLEAVLKEAETSGLAPLLGPAHLGLARIHLDAGQAGQALAEADSAVKAATPLGQRDIIFQAQHLAGEALLKDGKADQAAGRLAVALAPLEEMKRGLKDASLAWLLGRAETVSFGKDAGGLFLTAGRTAEAARLRTLLAP